MKRNDNLSKHKETLTTKNKALVERAIKHIQKLNGEITMSSVSRVTYEIADIEKLEKGLTLAGISKNLTYRGLVEQAKIYSLSEQQMPTHQSKNTKHLTDGDIRMLLYTERAENIRLKNMNKVLIQQLKDTPNIIETVPPMQDVLIKEHNAIMNICRSLTNRLCELELAYIDAETKTLRVAHYDDIIIPSDALNLFYKKELDDIRSHIYEDTPNN